MADAEERGRIEAGELEAFALEHGLDEEALEHVRLVLTEHGVEIPREDDEEELALDLTVDPAGVRPTRSAASSPRSAVTTCSPPPRKSRSRSASSVAT